MKTQPEARMPQQRCCESCLELSQKHTLRPQSAGHRKTQVCLPSPVQQLQPQVVKAKLWDENLQSLGTSLFRSHLSVQLRLTPLGLST